MPKSAGDILEVPGALLLELFVLLAREAPQLELGLDCLRNPPPTEVCLIVPQAVADERRGDDGAL